VAITINQQRFLSLDGKKLLRVIEILAAENPSPTAISRQLVAFGRLYHWDMPNMTPAEEGRFLSAYINLWLKGNR
jgi:hypothetical protein